MDEIIVPSESDWTKEHGCTRCGGSGDESPRKVCSACGGSGIKAEEQIAEAEEEIQIHLQRVLRLSQKRCAPLYPWVLVRVCEKEQERNGILLPDVVGSNQNKTVHEGIVLATWAPHWIKRTHLKQLWMESALKPGDHCLFQHFAGVPLSSHKLEKYRFVKEYGFAPDREGGIIATVEYEPKNTVAEQLAELIPTDYTLADGYYNGDVSLVIAAIMERFELVDKQQRSVTLSGR